MRDQHGHDAGLAGPDAKRTLKRIMNSRNGSATTKSAKRISDWSTAPPTKPAALPYTTPSSTYSSGATMPMNR